MLTKNWGTTHTYDHRDTSNMCLLCRAIALWFSLASKLIERYSKEGGARTEVMDEMEVLSPVTEIRKQRVSVKVMLTPRSKRKKGILIGQCERTACLRGGGWGL